MATLGKRRTERRPQPEMFWCVCGHDEHRMALWIEDDWFGDGHQDTDFGQVELVFGHQWLPWRSRLGAMWDVLRGRTTGRDWLTLEYADLVAMRDTLQTVIERIEARTEPEGGA